MFKKSLLYNSENHPRFMKVFSRLLNVFFHFLPCIQTGL